MIQNNIQQILKKIENTAINCGRSPSDIQLVAVSKRFEVNAIREAREAGQLIFGENYLQEAAAKKEVLKDTVRFHFIGHLQSNKAKVAAEIFDMVETVDRFKIAAALNRHLLTLDRKLDILIQVNIGNDVKKSGIPAELTADLINQIKELSQLRVRGLMTITPATDTPEDARIFFRQLRLLGEKLRDQKILPDKKCELSMGMSSDYHIAIEEGATLIRIGTAVFGQRPKTSLSQ